MGPYCINQFLFSIHGWFLKINDFLLKIDKNKCYYFFILFDNQSPQGMGMLRHHLLNLYVEIQLILWVRLKIRWMPEIVNV